MPSGFRLGPSMDGIFEPDCKIIIELLVAGGKTRSV